MVQPDSLAHIHYLTFPLGRESREPVMRPLGLTVSCELVVPEANFLAFYKHEVSEWLIRIDFLVGYKGVHGQTLDNNGQRTI